MESLSGRLANQPIVIDTGTGYIRGGFAGSSSPKSCYRTSIGTLKYTTRAMPGGALNGEYFVGPRLEEHRGALLLSYPMENGVIRDWNQMERLWSYMYEKENLNVRPEDHAVLLTEAPLSPLRQRARTAELFFEQLEAPALFVELAPVLALYASGRVSGLALDAGDGLVSALPVYEGAFIIFILIYILLLLFIV